MKTKHRRFLPLIFLALILACVAGGLYWYDNNVDRSGWKEKDGIRYYQDFHAKPVSGWLDLPEGRYCFHEDGTPMHNPPLLESLAADPLLSGVKLIAEAWDAGGLYQVGSFPSRDDRWAEWNGKYRDDLRRVREGHLDRARKLVNQGKGKIERSGAHDVRRFIKRSVINESGDEITRTDYSINEDVITEESKFDGFYAVCTNLEADVEEIIRVNKGRWEIEESFRIMKDDFDARPVYVQRDDRIKAHFMTCFISLLIFRILEKKLGSSYTTSDILSTLREMKVTRAGDTGYLPSYTRTHLTDSLHETAGFRTDYEILKKRAMQGVIRRSKGL